MFSQPKFFPAIEREDGTYAFYPLSQNSPGYLVSKAEGTRINTLFTQVWYSATPISIVLGKVIDGSKGLVIASALVTLAVIYYVLAVRKFIFGKPTLPPRPKSEFQNEYNRAYSRGKLIGLSLASLTFVIIGLWFAANPVKSEDHAMGLACASFFGLGFVVLVQKAITWRPPVG